MKQPRALCILQYIFRISSFTMYHFNVGKYKNHEILSGSLVHFEKIEALTSQNSPTMVEIIIHHWYKANVGPFIIFGYI